MAILQTWRDLAYGEGLNDKERENLWTGYFTIEKGIYEQILSDPTQVITGTVKELAERYNTEVLIMTGFLDGINESLKGYENPIDTMEEDTEVRIEIDPEKLYYNMVEAKANWLYELPQWDSILTEERRKELYKQQKASGTIRKPRKIGRNDPCPCGSGKIYKKCCGKNAQDKERVAVPSYCCMERLFFITKYPARRASDASCRISFGNSRFRINHNMLLFFAPGGPEPVWGTESALRNRML